MHPHTTTFAVELTAKAPRKGVADGAKLCPVGKVDWEVLQLSCEK